METCCICIDEVMADDSELLVVTSCQHLFHEQCLRQWVLKRLNEIEKADCPVCRKEIVYNEPRQIELPNTNA